MYPDPAGVPGRLRYWDGDRWTHETTDPGVQPPSGGDRGKRKQPRSDVWWTIGLAALAVVLLVATLMFWRAQLGGPAASDSSSTPTWSSVAASHSSMPSGSATGDNNGPISSGPWNEASAPVSVSSAAPSMTALPKPSVSCPAASKVGFTPQPWGKMAADTLQIDWVPFTLVSDGGRAAELLPWAYDVHTNELDHYYDDQSTGWTAFVFLGLLSKDDGYTDLAVSARQTMGCWAQVADFLYSTPHTTSVLVDESATIAGHRAWHIKANLMHVYERLDAWNGDLADIYVVDLGAGKDHFGLYIADSHHNVDPVNRSLIEQYFWTLTVVG